MRNIKPRKICPLSNFHLSTCLKRMANVYTIFSFLTNVSHDRVTFAYLRSCCVLPYSADWSIHNKCARVFLHSRLNPCFWYVLAKVNAAEIQGKYLYSFFSILTHFNHFSFSTIFRSCLNHS